MIWLFLFSLLYFNTKRAYTERALRAGSFFLLFRPLPYSLLQPGHIPCYNLQVELYHVRADHVVHLETRDWAGGHNGNKVGRCERREGGRERDNAGKQLEDG